MKKDKKQLKLNIKGRVRNLWNMWLLERRIKNLGVDVKKISSHSAEHVEIEVSGEKALLWDVIKWSKGPNVFIHLNEVIFEFADPVVAR